MLSSNSKPFRTMFQDFGGEPRQHSYYPIELATPQGVVHCQYYRIEATKQAAIWVGGIGGNWDTPAQGLYPRLCQDLMSDGIAALRLQFRNSTHLQESVLDVLAGINYLENEGIEAIALIGHSFGGAVVIQAAAQAEVVRTVVTLATQSYGTDSVSAIASHCSLLLLHGTHDSVLSSLCSRYVYNRAFEPKRLVLYPNAGHGLDEVAGEVHQTIRAWLSEQMDQDRIF